MPPERWPQGARTQLARSESLSCTRAPCGGIRRGTVGRTRRAWLQYRARQRRRTSREILAWRVANRAVGGTPRISSAPIRAVRT
eukprot:541148-Prymnesium_polylepis.1